MFSERRERKEKAGLLPPYKAFSPLSLYIFFTTLIFLFLSVFSLPLPLSLPRTSLKVRRVSFCC